MDWRRLAVLALVGALSIAAVSCGKKGTEPTQEQSQQIKDEIKPVSKQAYEECPDAIDYFCSVMEVKKQQLNLIFNFKTPHGAYSYDIGVDGKQDVTGSYIFFTDIYKETEDSEEETWSIAKKVTEAEKKERNLEKELGFRCNKNLYEKLNFEEPEEDPEAVKLSIDESTVKKYDEKRLDTDAIWECWNGYIDQTDHFAVSYYGDTSGWKTGQFDGKKWKMQQHTVFGDGEYYGYGAEAGLLWGFDGKRLMAGDKNGKTLYDFTISEWLKKNHLEQDATDKYTIERLTQKKVIFNRNLESKKRIASYVVDLKTLKVERSFDRELCGCYYEGIFYRFDSDKNILELINLETGETKEKVDYSAISEGIPESIPYRSYNEEMQELDYIEYWKGDEPIRYCVNENTGEVYFSYFNGVFHYNRETKALEKIVDSKNQKLFPDMHGEIQVGSDGKIYMLGFLGGGDDEGPVDFLYMTPEEKE